ncbi:sulfurtransferase [Fictibacillus sp. UD]|uniref:sulfurtransferase n=1 Tax=Fictibacillus sp. UD TaxID=3038777 RepID=UPI00374743B3
MSNFVRPEWVDNNLNRDDIVIFDCRFSLANPSEGIELYKQDHIEGAYYADLNQHLSAPVSTHGGRHPLPSVNILSQFLGCCGVDSEKIVVAYDDQSGAMASRLWWLLKYLGHDNVYVMQGGYTHYKEKGHSITRKMPIEKQSHFKSKIREDMLVMKEDIISVIKNRNKMLIDAREPNRYKGLIEPIDHKAGHIPTAINIPWEKHFQKTGWWKEKKELQEMYAVQLRSDEKAIVYCGSGVTACVNILAMNEAGITNTALYGGSWSDWISYRDNPVEKEQQE